MKYIVVIFVLLVLCGSAFAQGSFKITHWRGIGDFIYNKAADSVGVIIGTDTTWFTTNIIRRGLDTISELGPTIEGDEFGTGLMDSVTAAYDSSQAGLLNPADANVDTAAWNAAAGGGETNTLGDTGTFNETEGFGLAGGKTGTVLKVKGLIEGSNITIAKSGDSALTITSSGGAAWVASNDTMFMVDGDGDTLAAFWDDDAGNVRWQVATEDQTLRLLIDTVSGFVVIDHIYLDDGVGDSPVMYFKDADDETLVLAKLDAGYSQIHNSEAEIRITVSGDADDYVYFDTFAANIPMISTGGNCDLVINASSGEISLGDENLTTTGTVTSSSVVTDTLFADSANVNTLVVNNYTNLITGVDIDLAATDNITIDARTNTRTVTMGALRLNHTPQGSTPGTRAIYLDVNANSVPGTQGLHINYEATALAAGEVGLPIDIECVTSTSTGGLIRAVEVSRSGIGAATVHALHASAGVNPIHQEAGSFETPIQVWGRDTSLTAWANLTSPDAVGSSDIDSTLFAEVDDYLYVGNTAKFNEIDIVFNTFAGGSGISPTFEFSIAGPGWTVFTPIDNTDGCRQDGGIEWEVGDLTSWASVTVNGVASYYVRILRNQAGGITDPIEDRLRTSITTEYKWDSAGVVTVKYVITDTIGVGGDVIKEFAGTGLTVTSNELTADLGTSIADGEIDANTIDTSSLAHAPLGKLIRDTITDEGYLTNSEFSDSSITLLNATAWRLFFSNATTTAIQELALGGNGTYLKSNGASANPTWATPGGAAWNWTDSTGFLVGWGGVAKSVVNDTNYFRFEGSSDFDTTNGIVSIAEQVIDGDAVDSTSENFVFNDPYKGTSAVADSVLTTRKELGDTATAVRSKIRDTVVAVLDTIWFGMTIDNPDGLTKDSVMVLAVDAEWAPSGITLLSVGIKTWAATSYSVDFIEFTEPGDGGTESAIETVATSSSREAEDDGTLTDADIAAGSIIVVDLPATDIDQVMVWGTFTID